MSAAKPRGHSRKAALVVGGVAPIALASLAMVHPTPAPPPAPLPARVIVVSAAAPAPAPAATATAVPGATATPTPAPGAPPAPVPSPVAALPDLKQGIVTDMAPADCLAHFNGIDLPYQRGDAVAAHQTMVCHQSYILSYNPATHNPDWVLERLAPANLTGPAMRKDNFRQDPAMHGIDADLLDYSKPGPIGYDRGHQAPAGDAKFSTDAMSNSFFLYNMAPQIGIGFNRGVWKYLEESVRAWVLCGGHEDLFVITGPIYDPPLGEMGHDKVAVPREFYKIVYDPVTGRTVGFVLPNVKIGSRIDNLQTYVKPIAYIETETGLNFFRSWSQRQQTELKSQPGTAWGHIGTCKDDSAD